MDNPLVKALIFVVIIAVAVPFALQLIPEPLNFARAKAGFEAAGMSVAAYAESSPGGSEAIAQARMRVDGVDVQIYQYDNEGKIVMYMGYQKADPGQSIVAGWGLAESLGAAVSKPTPHSFKRNGMFLIVATSEDVELNKRIVEIFRKL